MTAAEPDVLVVGAGFARLCMTTKLKDAGQHNFVVLDDAVVYEFDESTDRWLVRTAAGAEFHARVVVVVDGSGLGACVIGRSGLTMDDARRGGMEPYLGVAIAGLPNFFLIGIAADAHAHYVVECLRMMQAQGATRIEVRAGTQREFNRRIHQGKFRRKMRGPHPSSFELSNITERESDAEYSGRAVLSAGARTAPVQVHLNGHFEPLDGNYHWYGRVVGDVRDFKKPNGSPLFLTIDGGPETPTALAEEDPWGNFRITGIGAPPYATVRESYP